MDYKLLALTLGPGLAIAVYVFWKDRFDREPLRLLVSCFLLGVLSAFLAVGIQIAVQRVGLDKNDSLSGELFHCFIIIGLSEEFSKLLFLRQFAYPKPQFNEPYDGIAYSVMVSMGFATIENIAYVYLGNSSGEALSVALIRMVTAIPAHASFAVIMGYFVGLAKFRNNSTSLMFIGLFAATFMHGLYDFFLLQNSIPNISAGAFISLAIWVYLSYRAIHIHQANSPYNTPNNEDENGFPNGK